jgi:hypothetical protein
VQSLDVLYGAGSGYGDAFVFTDTIQRLTLDLSGELISDSEADLRIAAARQ